MRTLAAIRTALEVRKRTGSWYRIAKAASVPYDTLARIARGEIKSPGIQLCERIDAAIDAVDGASTDSEPERAGVQA